MRISTNKNPKNIHFYTCLAIFGILLFGDAMIIFCQAVGLLFYDEVRVVEVPQVADSSTKSTHPRPSNLLPRQHKMPCHPLRCHVGVSQRLRAQNFECSIAETNQFQVI